MIISLYFNISLKKNQEQKPDAALIVPLAALIALLPADIFFNKLVPNTPNNMPRNPSYYYFD